MINEKKYYPTYNPNPEENELLNKIMERSRELDLFESRKKEQWENAAIIYNAVQDEDDSSNIPPINYPLEFEIINSLIADLRKIVPEAIIENVIPWMEDYIEAMKDIVKNIKSKNRYSAINNDLFFMTCIYWTAYRKFDFNITYKKISVPKKWWWYEKGVVLDYKDVRIQNISPLLIRMSEGAKSIDECVDLIHYEYKHYLEAEAEYWLKTNFKYVKPWKYYYNYNKQGYIQTFWWRSIKDETVEIMHYYNSPEDMYHIVINWVLMTDLDTPMPNWYNMKYPFEKVICMFSEIDRHWISFIDIINPTKRLINWFMNSMNKVIVMASNPIMKVVWDNSVVDSVIETWWIVRFDNNEEAQGTNFMSVPINNNVLSYKDLLDRQLITLTWVDSKSIINNQAESATKTAIKKESSIKRINLLADMFWDFFVRETKKLVEIVRYWYGDEAVSTSVVSDIDIDLETAKKNWTARTKNMIIPIKGKDYNWVWKNLTKKTLWNDKYWFLEVKSDMFRNIEYFVDIKPSSSIPFMETYEQEKVQNAMATLMQFPNYINQWDVIQEYIKAFQLPIQMKPDEERQQMEMQQKAEVEDIQRREEAQNQAPQSFNQLAPIPKYDIPWINK